jgi:hypothetical protein
MPVLVLFKEEITEALSLKLGRHLGIHYAYNCSSYTRVIISATRQGEASIMGGGMKKCKVSIYR